ncbi:hypothetical protein C2S53_001183 [Perilla frutescens var. hirtella]|uniref:Protein FAR1-RELATED SEQUENCE n=1 Tax=Perilla frutescens var. hirtella TaxID=608512 RepID=A0AAD4PGH2_PERFH|nr:hypothetical protein C2S53_001183 [Perilla frutescens var. hirtella]
MENYDEICSQIFGDNPYDEQEIYDLTIEDEDGGGERMELPTDNTIGDEQEICDLTIDDEDGGGEGMELPTDNTIGEDEDVDATVDAHNLDDDVSGAVDHEIPISGNGKSQLEGGQVNGSAGPQPGMLYATIDSLFDDYQAHARRSGFSAVKRMNRKMYDDKELKYARFVCSKAGKRNSRLLLKKTNCKARLNAKKLMDGSWVVGKIISEHNHDLDPSYSILMPAHRQLTVHQKRQLEAIEIAGIRLFKNIRLLKVQCGGPENLGALQKDCQNYIEERRRKMIGDSDAEAVRNLFNRLKLRYGNFYHLMATDNEGHLRNVLWIHPRSRAAYEDFHDALSFDTTYLINRHQMPFAAFIGVNHHENTSSFKWMFSNWLAAMGGVAHVSIITDQDESIKQALHEVMPDTIHRYCIWHIMEKLPIKFRDVADYNKVVTKWKGIVYDSLDKDTEIKWVEFLVEHHLEKNMWLQDLFSKREKWVPVYLNHTF